MALESQDLDDSYTYSILPESQVANYRSTDDKIDPSILVEYKDDQGDVVTPWPLYIPEEDAEAKPDPQDGAQKKMKPANVMQTFLKMSSVVYSMAGLGSVEESKVYRERFPSEDDKDSLKDEVNENAPKSEKAEFDEEAEDDPVFGNKDSLDVPTSKMKRSWLPSSSEVHKSIDILLRETDTVWMFVLPGTCKEIEGGEDVQRKKKVVTKEQGTDTPQKEDEKKTEEKAKESEKNYVKENYDLIEKWSQTIDFPRKKKGTQSDPIPTHESYAQVTSKDLLL